MPDALVSAYDWTSSLEKQMMENVDCRSQKVFLKHCWCLFLNLPGCRGCMVSALDSWSSGPGSSPGQGHAVGNPVMDQHPMQGRVEIFLGASFYKNRDKRRPDGPLGWCADFSLKFKNFPKSTHIAVSWNTTTLTLFIDTGADELP